ncbi:DNA recombination protein RmuC [Saxibacter everestensis]|uniref:DNA recombination protein RmuC n=1 Tax=Saxibacter everestensis TaxID=2909229 RepID=A0ABY8QNW4_9MICO|nr:DNA recombination protein RmuC [Brevibacteriaceae bacterium ZFBP1038]
MNTWNAVAVVVAVVVALIVGGVLGWLLAKVTTRADRIAAETERNMLRERVQDLEADAGLTTELAAMLGPLAHSVQRVEHQVQTLERDRTEQYARLDTQLATVAASGEALRSTTAQLVGSLRASTSRGSWGEVQLRRVVEHAGMLERVDFTVQAPGQNSQDAAIRPDMVVRLPGGKQIVVDAKAPLAAFLQASEQGASGGPTPEQLKAHAKNLRTHIDGLAAKEYWTAFTPTPELVLCFIPGESFLAAACSADPALLEHAMSKRVVLATPTTLLALLRTVALTWQQDSLSGSAKELYRVGRELYERLGTMGGHVEKLGGSLNRAVADYNRLVGTLESRVLVTARRMNDLDLTDRNLPAPEPITAAARNIGAPELLDDRESA